MPVLPKEPFVFPDLLFGDDDSQPAEPGQWWVLHTRPRAEKALARRLLRRDISFFLPLFERCRRARGLIVSAQVPLFPGYLFLRGDGHARSIAFETNLVAKCLTVGDEQQLHKQLWHVHRMMRADEPLHPESRIGPGTMVEIVDGPLAGLTGKVLRRGRQLRFFVEVDLLQRGVSIELERWMFKPAP
jgi:transcriptional antiterminator RfaH